MTSMSSYRSHTTTALAVRLQLLGEEKTNHKFLVKEPQKSNQQKKEKNDNTAMNWTTSCFFSVSPVEAFDLPLLIIHYWMLTGPPTRCGTTGSWFTCGRNIYVASAEIILPSPNSRWRCSPALALYCAGLEIPFPFKEQRYVFYKIKVIQAILPSNINISTMAPKNEWAIIL